MHFKYKLYISNIIFHTFSLLSPFPPLPSSSRSLPLSTFSSASCYLCPSLSSLYAPLSFSLYLSFIPFLFLFHPSPLSLFFFSVCLSLSLSFSLDMEHNTHFDNAANLLADHHNHYLITVKRNKQIFRKYDTYSSVTADYGNI